MTDADNRPTTIPCGCGEYSIDVSTIGPVYELGAACPECGHHFGWNTDSRAVMPEARDRDA